MAINIESNAEPLPGYRLVERLGGGGFGEVWKAVAPGGVHKAIKFVYGFLDSNDEDAARAEQELRALERVKIVRHSFILALDRIDKVEGQLLIVMELADRTLWDRFKECRSQGLVGIPRRELVRYMKESAEALDFMYSRYQLLHLDIKPQNLFLVETHIKVADFGLIKNMTGSAASITGGVTPVYAAPETFDGEGRATTDQYSLAIVYQEMLTGQRPFGGTTARQLVLQHLQAEPDLTALSRGDRTILRKALNKNYQDRYPTCLAFAEALEAATSEKTSVAASGHQVSPPAPSVLTNGCATQTADSAAGAPPRPTTLTPALPSTEQSRSADSTSPLLECRSVQLPTRPTPLTAVNEAAQPSGALPEIPPSMRSAELKAIAQDHSTVHRRPHTSEMNRPDVLLPALVIGIGTLGQASLKQLRRQIHLHCGTANLPHLRTLYLDSDPEAMTLATQGGECALAGQQRLLLRLQRASHYLKPRDGCVNVQTWLPARMLHRITRQLVPDGVRALGRLAFVDNFEIIRRRLKLELDACQTTEVNSVHEEKNGLPGSQTGPRVYVVTSLAGGTGSGMFIDVAYAVRELLKEAGIANPDLVAVLLLPETDPAIDGKSCLTPALANTFAALTELQHFGRPGSDESRGCESKTAQTNGERHVSAQEPPFRRCILLPQGKTRSAGDEMEKTGMLSAPGVVRAANLLFTELCTPLGTEIDLERQKWLERLPRGINGRRDGVMYQTSELVRIHWPYQQIVRRTASELCRRLVAHWSNKDAKPLRESVKEWVQVQWAELNLSANQLIERLQDSCQKSLKIDPILILGKVLEPLSRFAPTSAKNGRAGRGAEPAIPVSIVVETLEGLEVLLGVPENCQGPGQKSSSSEGQGQLADLLDQATAALVYESEGNIAELAVRLIEQPEFRLAGAEETLRQFSAIVQRALENQEELTREMQEHAASLYVKIHTLAEDPGNKNAKDSTWSRSRSRRSPGAQTRELLEVLQAYPKCQFQSLVLQKVQSFYVSLRGLLSDQLREVDYCRDRLGELAGKFEAEAKGAATLMNRGVAWQLLLPEGCETIDAAVAQASGQIAPDEFIALDHQVEEMIRNQFRALVHVCMASSCLLRNLVPQMLAETEAFLQGRLPAADAAALYLDKFRRRGDADQPPDEAAAFQSLRMAYNEAQPAVFGSSDEDSICILATPDGSAAEQLRRLARHAVPRTRLQFAPAMDEIVLYREQLHTSLDALQQLTRRTRPAYERVADHEYLTPHSRLDIANWTPLRS
jgi:serine/threonine protein kinase